MVILPTALGKTVISSLAAAYFLSNHWNMKILVMAPTRPLVLQHKDTLSKFLRIKAEDMVILTGKVLPSYRKHLWAGEAKVFFATPQVVRPVIMATTASPGSNHKNIHQTCSDLYVEQVEFRTEEDPDVAPYIYRVDVKWRQVDLPKEYREMGETLRSILWARLRRLESLGVVKKYRRYVTRRDL